MDANEEQLIQWPVEEIELLRTNAVHMQDIKLKSGTRLEVNVTDASLVTVFCFHFHFSSYYCYTALPFCHKLLHMKPPLNIYLKAFFHGLPLKGLGKFYLRN